MRLLTSLLVLTLCTCVRAQDFNLFATGNLQDTVIQANGGVCLMGGATENDEAMRWFLRRANGGDIVVLRTSGSDGYNNYFFNELGVAVNSVRTFVFNSGAAAGAVEVLDAIAGAEAVWLAGGNQAEYVEYWRGTAVDSLIRDGIVNRKMAIGGTSAGMAVLGGHYYTAANGSVTSAEALADPFDERVTVDSERFLDVPGLENYITDTHFSERDRQGRLTTFMALKIVETNEPVFAIACDDFTAVCIDELGMASVYGTPGEDDFAYFISSSCMGTIATYPSVLTPGQPLTFGSEFPNALGVHRVAGNDQVPPVFCLPDFRTVSGDWTDFGWWVSQGNWASTDTPVDLCVVDNVDDDTSASAISLFPNPTPNRLNVTTDWQVATAQIIDVQGRLVRSLYPTNGRNFSLSTLGLSAGSYYLLLTGSENRAKRRFIVP